MSPWFKTLSALVLGALLFPVLNSIEPTGPVEAHEGEVTEVIHRAADSDETRQSHAVMYRDERVEVPIVTEMAPVVETVVTVVPTAVPTTAPVTYESVLMEVAESEGCQYLWLWAVFSSESGTSYLSFDGQEFFAYVEAGRGDGGPYQILPETMEYWSRLFFVNENGEKVFIIEPGMNRWALYDSAIISCRYARFSGIAALDLNNPDNGAAFVEHYTGNRISSSGTFGYLVMGTEGFYRFGEQPGLAWNTHPEYGWKVWNLIQQG